MKRMLIVIALLASAAAYSEDATYEVIYMGKNSKVILTESTQKSKTVLDSYGKQNCSSGQFCVLWFYSNRDQAGIGAAAMKRGDMYAQTPGMYAIFSKNKMLNEIICYEPTKGC